MRKWNTPDDMARLSRFVEAIKDLKILAPTTFGDTTPLDMRGLTFPTVDLCNEMKLPTMVVSRVVGRQEFDDATMHDIDLSESQLDFSVWNNCNFERVCFDAARLHQVRFFGCTFTDCSFRRTRLQDASFSVGRSGRETEVVRTIFEKANFCGASCHNPVFRHVSFLNCKFGGFVFDGALFEAVIITGRHKELTFRGWPNDPMRNELRADLSAASILWMDCDQGIDLKYVKLPVDGSCFVVGDRIRAVPIICERLMKEGGDAGKLVAKYLVAIYSDRSISPKAPSQTMFLVTRAMVAELAETNNAQIVEKLRALIRAAAEEGGFLVSTA